jgi:hypothetical protein
MAITLNDLKSMLQRPQVRIFTDEDNTLLYPFVHGGQPLNVEAQLIEAGDYLRLRIPYFLSCQECQDRSALLTRLMELNYSLKMLKFGYDPQDGEVTVSIEIPLEDNELTARQVHRCMYMLTSVAVQERDRLLNWMRTGIYPGSDDPHFIETLDRLLPPDESTAEPDSEQPDLFADDLLDLSGLLDDAEDLPGNGADLD